MTGPGNWLSQIGWVTLLGLQTIFQRKGASAAATFGIAGVVAVLVGVLSIAKGFERAMTISGSPETAIVLRAGSDTEMMSILGGETARIIEDFPGIVRGAEGPMASAELYVILSLPKRSTGTDANVPLRGVEPAAFQIRDELRIVEGRAFQPGRNEVIVGRAAAGQFSGMEVGEKLKVGRSEWTVVGMFEAGGGIAESEIWTDAGVLQPAYQRGNSFQAVYVKLTSAEALDELNQAFSRDPRLNVKAVRQTDYYAEQSRVLSKLITILGSLIAGMMGVGAVFGALNTMYTAVSARTREIATLRALGFGGSPVVISVLIESLFLALVGGVIGATLAYLAFDGYRAATLNWQSFSQVAFAFAVTPGLLVQGIACAAVIGLIGGFFPALRAARLPVAVALREV
jgi:putative ABC transport system permease protein